MCQALFEGKINLFCFTVLSPNYRNHLLLHSRLNMIPEHGHDTFSCYHIWVHRVGISGSCRVVRNWRICLQSINITITIIISELEFPVPDSSCVCVALKVLLPALVMVVMETESVGRVRRMRMGVGVRAGGEAARAGRSGARVGDRARPRARAWILKERAVLLSAGTAEGGVEVTVLAAKRRGLERRRGGGGRGERGGKVPFSQPLGVCDSWGGRGSGGLGEVPQGAVLFDHPSVLARSICPLDGGRSLLLLLHFRQPILKRNIVISICCEAVTVGCERVLPVADWWTCV